MCGPHSALGRIARDVRCWEGGAAPWRAGARGPNGRRTAGVPPLFAASAKRSRGRTVWTPGSVRREAGNRLLYRDGLRPPSSAEHRRARCGNLCSNNAPSTTAVQVHGWGGQYGTSVEDHRREAFGWLRPYPLGVKGVVVGEGDTYEEALADFKSAIRFHVEAFGKGVLEGQEEVIEAFVAETGIGL